MLEASEPAETCLRVRAWAFVNVPWFWHLCKSSPRPSPRPRIRVTMDTAKTPICATEMQTWCEPSNKSFLMKSNKTKSTERSGSICERKHVLQFVVAKRVVKEATKALMTEMRLRECNSVSLLPSTHNMPLQFLLYDGKVPVYPISCIHSVP